MTRASLLWSLAERVAMQYALDCRHANHHLVDTRHAHSVQTRVITKGLPEYATIRDPHNLSTNHKSQKLF